MVEKLLRLNLGSQEIKIDEIPEAWKRYGGRALTAAVLQAEVNPGVDPLSPANKLILAAGLLAGSGVPCSGRLSIGAKSPLTGTIKESNVGGTAAQRLARLGYRAVIVEGELVKSGPAVLVITANKVSLQYRPELAGMGNYQTAELLLKEFGPEAAVISIGPVGEMALPVASVAVTNREGFPSRHAGRGGMGAVMGSKGLKAIVLVGQDGVSRAPAQKEAFNNIVKEWSKGLIKGKQALTRYGTAMLVNVINGIGGLPTRNFRKGRFEMAEKLSGEELEERALARGGRTAHACHRGCVIRCSNIYHDEQGQYLTSALEYETLCLLGSNLGIGDIDAVARFDRLCDDLGIDTMEIGAALGVAMEGGMLSFGDSAGVMKLLQEVGRGTVNGRLLGQGAATVGKVLGAKRIPTVKGQSLSAYDPRALKGTGVTYATSPMGADHTAGNCLPGRGGLDTKKDVGQTELSRQLQIISAACDALGVCIFVGPTPDNVGPLTQLLSYFTGQAWQEEDLLELGKEVLRMELEYNRQAGFKPEDDDLPVFFREEVLPETGTVFDIPQIKLAEVFGDFFARGAADEELGLVFRSPRMQEVIELVRRVAKVNSTVLLLGESGVGKEVIARYLHCQSPRSQGPFLRINCGAIPENLLESELFGYEPGAFTGAGKGGKPGLLETASGGTVLLDEIGDLPLSLQVKLLRVLQEREVMRVGGTRPIKVDVRIIAATNRNLEQMVAEGKFREDLFFRLHVVPVHIPPLRERREDILPLIRFFLDRIRRKYDLDKELADDTLKALLDYHWPGNIRELENVVEQLVVTAPGRVIGPELLPAHVSQVAVSAKGNVRVEGIIPLKQALDQVEMQLLQMAMDIYGSTYKVAEVLGVNQSTIVRKLSKYKTLN